MSDVTITPESIIKEKTGIELNFTQALADTIVSQYMTSIGEDVLKNTFDLMNEKYLQDKLADPKNFKFKLKEYTGGWNSKYEDTKLGSVIDHIIADKYGNTITEYIDEYMKTDEFKEKLKKMADEVIDYALNGYKEDMIKRLRERLVGNAYSTSIWEDGQSIDDKVHGTIRDVMQSHMNASHNSNNYYR